MTVGERIKKVRRSLDLTQQEFCGRIGLKRNSISLIESGSRNTSDQTIYSICREFGVNEEWLRNGHGEMFAPKATNALEELAKERGLSHGTYIALEKFLNLKPELQDGIIAYFAEIAAALNSDNVPASSPAMPGATPEDLHAELDRQIAEEKEATAESEVS